MAKFTERKVGDVLKDWWGTFKEKKAAFSSKVEAFSYFPNEISGFWPAGRIFGELYQGTSYVNLYKEAWEEGKVVPLLYKNGWVAMYKVGKSKKYGYGGDYASWDDRMQYDLKLMNVLPVKVRHSYSNGTHYIKVGQVEQSITEEEVLSLRSEFTHYTSKWRLHEVETLLYFFKYGNTTS